MPFNNNKKIIIYLYYISTRILYLDLKIITELEGITKSFYKRLYFRVYQIIEIL